MLIFFRLDLPVVDDASYGAASLVSIALIARMLFGLAPMAIEVEKALLRFCGSVWRHATSSQSGRSIKRQENPGRAGIEE
ncbi:hypothetical protein LFL96_36795 (plasmid) [Paraburkholderia sp. D15]|uniref:hypothetical protein n=1 Tax=Paraburkholderia sp. D15 TaxID=2880218 RepID=UPI00247AEF9F|nr:hypothetical protein [Paraburkholderia sp. D15]WGS55037.1 hypothetical protein LFL96_36795 [Paraburkholderia sp. D15]